jgi:AcrR family transcriptional regulator
MARTVDHQYRQAIAERAAAHLLEHGRVNVSLRELAAAVEVSPRMLVHHFGSREELVSRALHEARSRQRAAFEARLTPQPGRPYVDVLTDAWRWFMSDEAKPYMRLFGQLYALAGAPGSPHAAFLRESVLDWIPTLEAGFAADGADPDATRELATLTVGVVRFCRTPVPPATTSACPQPSTATRHCCGLVPAVRPAGAAVSLLTAVPAISLLLGSVVVAHAKRSEENTMRVFVAGASGAIGTRLVPQLLD